MVDPIRLEPTGDDQKWKRDVDRMTRELADQLEELQSQLKQAQGRAQ